MPARIARIVVALFSISSATPAAAASHLLSQQNDPLPITIYSSYTLENTTAKTLKDVEFLVSAPVKRTSFQHCVNVTGSRPHTVETDEIQNQTVRFVFEVIPPHARKHVSLHARVLQNGNTGWPIAINPSMYLLPARYIESGHEKIVRIAQSLSDADPVKTAGKIYHFVSEHVRSTGFSGQEYGALYALESRRGDCTESMYLFVALCRAAGVPARCIGGYTLSGSTVLRPSRYHNWAEFHDGRMWRMSDPQRKVFTLGHSGYIATRVLHDFPDRRSIPFHRFSVSDARVKAVMNE